MPQIQGLTTAEVEARLAAGLNNRWVQAKTKTIQEILFENLFCVFNIIIGAIVSFLLFFFILTRDPRLPKDAIGVAIVALLNTLIAIFQEIKAKQALDKVNLLLKRAVSVLRDGEVISIEPSELVQDDVVFIQRGDQVVVDGRVIESKSLEIDESLLTGESVPIAKSVGDSVLSGSFCVSGHGYFVAERLGQTSFAAHITQLAKKYKFAPSFLQNRINFIVKTLFGVAVVLTLAEGAIALSGHGFNVERVRKIATILVSLVPQGLVLMTSVTFALGVFRISRIGAIIQKLNAIEAFSGVHVICMDKTGTLTKNQLTVHSLTPLSEDLSLSYFQNCLGAFAAASTERNATIRALEIFPPGEFGQPVDEIPFSSERKMSVLKFRQGDTEFSFIFGAYDILRHKINNQYQLTADHIMTNKSLGIYRNLLFGLIEAPSAIDKIRAKTDDFLLQPIGIVSITDEIREDAHDVIHQFQDKGIRFKILSGDSPDAVRAVCHDLDWQVAATQTITGQELNQLSPIAFDSVVMEKTIFCRLSPEHKLKIIQALRRRDIFTAMIGDGVNDLPAIKEADMGIAMEEGSAITKEVADIVLLQNRFSLLPKIFDEGNKIINSVDAVAKLFLTKNFVAIYLSLLSLFLLLEFPLTPRRVSLINLFAIGLPAFIITMRNRNVERKHPHFLFNLLTFAALSSAVMVASGYAGFYLARTLGKCAIPESEMVMLMVMVVVSVVNFLIVVLNKTEKKMWPPILCGGLILTAYFLLVYSSDVNQFLHQVKLFYEIVALGGSSWQLIFGVSIPAALVLLGLQRLRERML